MYRIDTTTKREKWQFVCPTPMEHTDWRVVDGHFQCNRCQKTFNALRNQKTGELVHREEIEIVGPKADHQGEFGRPTVDGD